MKYPEKATRFVVALCDVLTGEQLRDLQRKVYGVEHSPGLVSAYHVRTLELSSQQQSLLESILGESMAEAADANLQARVVAAEKAATEAQEQTASFRCKLDSLRYLEGELASAAARLASIGDALKESQLKSEK